MRSYFKNVIFWIDFFKTIFISHFAKPTSDRQEDAKMTDFDQISAHSFRHLPSLWALGGWQLPLWCKNMPFGKSTAVWRALLNYPKNIFFMHFHHAQRRTARWAPRFEGLAFTLRCDGWLIEIQLQKNVCPQSERVGGFSPLFGASSNRIIYNISTGCQANISSELFLCEWLQPLKSSFNFSHRSETQQKQWMAQSLNLMPSSTSPGSLGSKFLFL